MPIRLGSLAPDFTAHSTKGDIKFHEYLGDNWGILFSHPADFTPVCTTELGLVAALHDEFEARKVKVIGLSANGLSEHDQWIKDINEINNVKLDFPIIADGDRNVSTLYDMLDNQDPTNVDNDGIPYTVRSVFVIDPTKTVRLIMTYPASTGRNFDEILRVVDSLQLGDQHRITTPGNWKRGDDVIVHPDLSTAEAQRVFKDVRVIKPYLRLTSSPF
ncbi:thioredoxin-like protein [Halteromyces radiatus]|uniref:thioredoxin-like protein n=1 Tax=Halteromyces radiatus TaxID=101107 RepID=UPI00221FD440|nr:thioredoxin-like protein [Halteromyces radiatus]KAI8099501.1 thioredoxin-like protein [Halteromyces radiatus]